LRRGVWLLVLTTRVWDIISITSVRAIRRVVMRRVHIYPDGRSSIGDAARVQNLTVVTEGHGGEQASEDKSEKEGNNFGP